MCARVSGIVVFLLLTVSIQVHTQQTLTRCRGALDLIIAVDGSNSMGEQNFRLQLNSVVNMVNNLDVSPNNVHVGALLYSQEVDPNIIRLSPNKQQVINGIRSWTYPDQQTRTDLAIEEATDMFARDGRGGNVPQIFLVVTDGASTIPSRTLSAAALCKGAGTNIFTVGVSGTRNELDVNELRAVASTPSQALVTSDFATLETTLNAAANQICVSLDPPPVPACFMGQTDLWYVVDLSMSAERLSRFDFTNDFAQLKNGLTEQINIVMDPSVANPGVRMGLVTYSDQAQRLVSPSDPGSVARTAQQVNNIPGFVRVGGTNLVPALQQITTPPQQSRWNSYVAVVTPQSAYNSNFNGIQAELNRLRQLGYVIVLFTVRDQSVVSPQQLALTSSGAQYFYYLQDYVSLEAATKNFTRDTLCGPPRPLPPPTTTTLPPPVVITNGLCARTRYQQDGMDVLPHPRDCDKYVQCYYNANTRLDIAVVRDCPMGLHWNQASRTCVTPAQANCPTDQCREDCDAYKMTGACGAYWECEAGRSVARCCRPMFAFRPGKGCVFQPTCQEDCTPRAWCGLCMKRPNYQQPYGYDVMMSTGMTNPVNPPAFGGSQVGASGWSPRHCDNNHFDVVTCDCTRDMRSVCPADRSYNFRDNNLVQQIQAGRVDGIRAKDVQTTGSGVALGNTGEIHVDVNRAEAGRPFSMIFRFSEGQTFSPYGEVLLTAGVNCGSNRSLVVNADDRFIHASVRSSDGKGRTISVPYQGISPNEFKNLGLTYDNGMLTLAVTGRNHQYVAQSQVPADICFSCGIDIGGALNRQSFTGQVESISVFSCRLQTFSNQPFMP